MNRELEWGADEGDMSFAAAVALAQSRGDGWRLPSVVELLAQFDFDTSAPKDATWRRVYYWTASHSNYCARGVDLYFGQTVLSAQDLWYAVRLVR